jgi:dsDNA-specific endonuclease/ATPase MutS2
MPVNKLTTPVQETVTVEKTTGVAYKSSVSDRELKVTKSQRKAGSFVVTLNNAGGKSIVMKKAALQEFLEQVEAFMDEAAA